MTGHLQIQLIQDKVDKISKWIVWKRNIGKKYFSGITKFSYNLDELSSEGIEKLTTDSSHLQETEWPELSPILPSDLLRPFTIKEYIILGQYLKKYGYTYNKKKDIFVKHNLNK